MTLPRIQQCYHRDCYQSLTSALHLERAKHQFEKTSGQRRVAVARSQIGRPKLEEEPMASTSDERVHRSSIAPHERSHRRV